MERPSGTTPWLTAAAMASLCVLAGGDADTRSVAAEKPAPGDVLDLTSWKITLPISGSRAGKPAEITQPKLGTYARPPYFVVQPADGPMTPAVRFRAPCGGVTTKNSRYPRCELREMTADGRDKAAWATTDGQRHELRCRLAVGHLPAVKPHVVCAQIHDRRDDVLMIRVEGRKLLVERTGEPDLVLRRDYALGTFFDLQIVAEAGRVVVVIDGEQVLDWPLRKDGCYFKVGCYTQSNPDRGDAVDAYGEVLVESLALTHGPA